VKEIRSRSREGSNFALARSRPRNQKSQRIQGRGEGRAKSVWSRLSSSHLVHKSSLKRPAVSGRSASGIIYRWRSAAKIAPARARFLISALSREVDILGAMNHASARTRAKAAFPVSLPRERELCVSTGGARLRRNDPARARSQARERERKTEREREARDEGRGNEWICSPFAVEEGSASRISLGRRRNANRDRSRIF